MEKFIVIAKSNLPEGWKWVKLGEICNFVNGDAFKPTDWDKTGIPIIRIQNLNDATKSFNYWNGSTNNKVPIKNNDVLLAWSGTPGTSFGCHIWNRGNAILNQHIFRVDFKNKATQPEFFTYAVNFYLQGLIDKAHGGVGLRHVTKKEVESLIIPLPPIDNQIRITKILSEKLDAIGSARIAAKKQLSEVKALRIVILKNIFPSLGKKLPDQWEWKKIGQVCQINPRREFIFRENTKLTSFIQMSSVDEKKGTISIIEEKQYGTIKKGYTYFEESDVLFAKITPCMQNGKHTVASGLIDGIGFGSTEFHVIKCSEKIKPEWVHLYLRQKSILKLAETQFTGSVGQQRVPSSFLESLLIPLPSIDIQQEKIIWLMEKMDSLDRIENNINEQMAIINALPQAYLGQAFRGEL